MKVNQTLLGLRRYKVLFRKSGMSGSCRFRGMLSSNGGGVAVAATFMIPIMLTLMALVVDAGRLYTIKNKAQNAADAALLGAAASISTANPQKEFVKLFNANFPSGYLGSSPPTIDFNIVPGEGTVTITVQASTLMGKLGFSNSSYSTITVTSGSVGGMDQRYAKNLELALVIDNSKSMESPATANGGGSKMEATKKAAKALVRILYGEADTSDKLNLTLLPYDEVVNIGPGHADFMQEMPSGPKTDRAPGTTGYERTKLAPRDRYEMIEDKEKKGFASTRSNDAGKCGPYQLVSYNAAGIKKICNCPKQYETDETYTDPETQEKKKRKGCSVGKDKWDCREVPYEAFLSAEYIPTCKDVAKGIVPNGYNDITDAAPTTEATKFTLPFETTDEKGKTVKYADYMLNDPSTLPSGIDGNAGGNRFIGGELDRAWLKKLAPMLFSSNNKKDILDAIDKMEGSGNTRINVGLMWAWFTLSPKWQGLWDKNKAGLPAAFSDKAEKAIVLMTDGRNLTAADDRKTEQLCAAIKAQGITIYTVGLGTKDEIKEELLLNCASKPEYYFYSPTEEDLSRAFKLIADIIYHGSLKLRK
jgi:Flp pilus assembly protein TadG